MARILSDRSIRRRARLAKTSNRANTAEVTLRSALEAVKATTGGVKVPNGTTKKIDRIVTDALASV